MRPDGGLRFGAITIGCAGLFFGTFARVSAQAAPAPTPARVAASADISGTVTGPHGPEAGVWVIAETSDLPTKYAKIVVTDDRGRYLLPELPKANYSVWVRGYGLVDSPKTPATPGSTINLTAVVAPDAARGRSVFPRRILVFAHSRAIPLGVPRHRGRRQRHQSEHKSQAEWIRLMKSGGCTACHQLGTKGTREIPAALGHFDSPVDAWKRRIQSGQAGGDMSGTIAQLGEQRAVEMFADWTTRIAHGEVPPTPAPPQRDRAQRRHHRVGLGGPESVSARRGLYRPAKPDPQCERVDLRLDRAQP